VGCPVTWTKLSDDFTDETWTLSDAAAPLLVDLHVWSNRKLLDCKVPLVDLPRASRAHEALDELLAGRWCATDGETVVVRFHAVYQRTREQVQAQQEANKRNGARGGRPRKPGRERPETQSLSESLGESPSERDGTGRDWNQKRAPTEVDTCAATGCTSAARHGLATCYDHAQFEIELYAGTVARARAQATA